MFEQTVLLVLQISILSHYLQKQFSSKWESQWANLILLKVQPDSITLMAKYQADFGQEFRLNTVQIIITKPTFDNVILGKSYLL